MQTPGSRRRGRVIGAGLASGLALAGCVDLPLIEEDECGNRVIEPGEACDGDEAGCAQPGTQHECRYLCPPLLDGVECPAAYGCGLDGVCRRPSGAFEPTIASSTATTSDMLVGDLDADGCAEMVRAVSRGTILVTSFASRSPGLCAASEQGLVAYRPGVGLPPRPAPLLFDLTRAGTSPGGPPGAPQPAEEEATATLEIVAPGDGPLGSGVLVYFADTPPALPSLIHPSLRLPEPGLRALSVRDGDTDALLLLLAGTQGATQVAIVDDPLLLPAPLGTIPIPFEEIGALTAADLDGGSPGCDEVALARRDASSIQLYRLCDAAGTKAWAPLPSPEVVLDGGVAIHAENPSIALVDYNADGHADLLTHTAVNSIHIAYGLGDGRFHSSEPPVVVPDQRTSELVPPIPQPGATSRKLVAGNFDATPGAEFSLISCPPASEDFGSPVCARIPGACEAVVADIDADGYDDVVIAESQQPDLIVHRGRPEGLAPPLYLATQCPPHHVTASDVDADDVPDIAFFDQVAPSVGNPVTALSVAFGNALAAPAPPEVLGRLELAHALVGGRFTEGAPGDQLFAARLDGVQLGEMPGPGTRTALALVEGLTERLVRAPFYFPPPEGDPASVASVELRATAAGFFTLDADGAPRPGLAAVTGGDLAVWRVENDEFPGVLVGAQAGALNPPGAGQALQCDRCVLAAIDVDADRRDDLLVIDDRHVAVLASSQDGFVRRDCDDAAFTYRASVWSNPPEYAPRPLVADLDGDGRQDVVLRAETGALIALWGRADGCFDEIPLLSAQGCGPEASCGDLSIARIDADHDAEEELVVAGPAQLEIFDVNRGARALESKGPVAGTVPPPPDTDFTAIGAADVDGDGVQDLVLMPTSNFVRVLRGVPELE